MRHREALELVQDHTASDRAKRSLHLPPSLSLTRVHPFLPFQKGPACIPGVTCTLHSPVSHLETPLLVRLAAQRSPAPCIGHRTLGHGVGGEGFRVQPDSFLPSKAGKGNQPKTEAI